MMLTEEQARTKLCPLLTKRGLTSEKVRCAASGCMKWRWVPGGSPEEQARWNPTNKPPNGYCGA